MRDLTIIIDKIIEQIPEEQYKDLIDRLRSYKSSAGYSSPEGMSYWWNAVSIALNLRLPYPPVTEWQQKILDIMRDKE